MSRPVRAVPGILSVVVVFAVLVVPLVASAAPKVTSQAKAEQHIKLQVGETQLVHLSESVIRVSVADPTVADVQVVTPKQVLITARGVGSTHLILWGESEDPLVVAIACSRNLDQLRTQLKELFPNEKLSVDAAGELVVLSGEVSDLRLPARAAELAQLYSDQLANLVEVSGDQQVQLDVRFAEVSRTGLRQMGMNVLWRDLKNGYIGGQAGPGTQTGQFLDGSPAANGLNVPGTSATGPPFISAPNVAGVFNLFFSSGKSDFPLSAILSVLSQEGLAKVLAEPTLVALSGQEAKFHAGGEIPLLIARQLGEVTVEYKKFGVQLKFTPTVLGNGRISLKMGVAVSEPDASTGATFAGITVPGFRTRASETTVRLMDGQSFAVAGLLSDTIRSSVDKVPLLGDLPVLGALFRSTAFQREETELLVVVKASLVRPLNEGELPPLPGEDELTDPTDFELFLLGRISGKKKSESTTSEEGTAPESTEPTSSEETTMRSSSPAGPIGFVREL